MARKKATTKPRAKKVDPTIEALAEINQTLCLILARLPQAMSAVDCEVETREIDTHANDFHTGAQEETVADEQMNLFDEFPAGETTAQEETTTEPETEKKLTKEDVTQKLQEVSTKAGLPAVKAVLDKFGAPNVSGIPQSKYPLVIKECASQIASV